MKAGNIHFTGGGTCMDVAKTIAFGVMRDEDVWGYLTGELPALGTE